MRMGYLGIGITSGTQEGDSRPKDLGVIKCEPGLVRHLRHQEKIGSPGHYVTQPCELWTKTTRLLSS